MSSVPRRQALVITVLNLKGGVGKTHTGWLTAAVCDERQLRLLIIDTDTQGNLSNSFLEHASKRLGVERLLDPSGDTDAASLVQRTRFPGIDIIPASPALVRFDISDQRQWEAADLHLSFVDAVQELRGDYDLISLTVHRDSASRVSPPSAHPTES